MAHFLPDLDPTVMIVRCVNDRMVTSGHTHRSSYAKLVNNGDIHVTYSQNIPMDSSQSIYAVCRQFLATKSTHLRVSTVFEFVHRLLSILLCAHWLWILHTILSLCHSLVTCSGTIPSFYIYRHMKVLQHL